MATSKPSVCGVSFSVQSLAVAAASAGIATRNKMESGGKEAQVAALKCSLAQGPFAQEDYRRKPRSGYNPLQVLGIYFYSSVLVYQLECQYESHSAPLPHKGAAHALHDPALNADFFADDKLVKRFDPLSAETGAKKLDFGIRKWDILSAVAHDMQHAWTAEDPQPLTGVDMNKEIIREQRQGELYPLPVLPDAGGLIGRQTRFDLSQRKMLYDRLLVLRNGEHSVPIADALGVHHHRT
jgi:hypothetical protein